MERRSAGAHCLSILLLVMGMLLAAVRGEAGFHDQDPLECEGCHSLKAKDPSSRCLQCHSKIFRVLSTTGDVYTPGGDFFWLKRSYSDGDYQSFGDSHGHNIVAADFNLGPDSISVEAPGDGQVRYASAWLGCTSCHDPHKSSAGGKGFRLLGGVGYKGGGKARSFKFSSPAPVAKGSPSGSKDWGRESDRNHTAYGSGMSEWCANCHSGFTGRSELSHPAGRDFRMGKLAARYNLYRSATDRKGERESGYDFLLPFERGEIDRDLLDTSSTEGPDFEANVMCLTCHRAHATPFKGICRWDTQSEFLSASPVLMTAEGAHAYYGENVSRRYGKSQRTLCIKCHDQE